MKTRLPDEIKLFCAIDSGISFKTHENIVYNDVKVELNLTGGDLLVYAEADTTPLYHLRLRWNFTEDECRRGVKVMGDAWERSYGELEWRGVVPHRFMPWYVLVSNGDDLNSDTNGRFTEAFGVAVRPSAMCTWQYDTKGVNLWLDLRCGGEGVILASRKLEVCNVMMREYRDMSAFDAGKSFCGEMCTDPLRPPHTVYGSNNWYYAVGDSSHEQILRDTELIASLTEELDPRPYMVVDDGWQINPCDGPWEPNERFPDMARLASEMKERGVIPGIWVRFLLDKNMSAVTEEMCVEGRPGVLDPSVPETLQYIKDTVKKLTGWGYKLIKHDFTHIDLYNANGYEDPKTITDNGWHYRDRSRTSAEIALDLYRAILDSAEDDTIILACDTPSHLTAGLAHLMRTGFDTSGRYFERTRISGVNTLAFRLMQNETFYIVDADCCSHTGRIDWELNKEWLRLISDSGTALFISADPDKVDANQFEDMKRALKKSATEKPRTAPIDWMSNATPEVFLVDGEEKTYQWYAEEGTHQFIPPTHPEY